MALLTYRVHTTLWPSATAKFSRLRVSRVSVRCCERGMSAISALMRLIVCSMALRSTACPKPWPPPPPSAPGSCPSFCRLSRKRAKAHSLSVLPPIPLNHSASMDMARARLTCFQPPMLPLCMNIRLPWRKGWQLLSDREPSVVARTWAKIRDEAVFEASRSRFKQFHAGIVEVNIQGSGPSAGGV